MDHIVQHIQNQVQQHGETIKHTVDAVAIPGGLIVGYAHIMDFVNGIMTFLVLATSLIWGVYRIIDMRNKNRRSKRKG